MAGGATTIDVDLKPDPEPAGLFEAIAALKEELDTDVELAKSVSTSLVATDRCVRAHALRTFICVLEIGGVFRHEPVDVVFEVAPRSDPPSPSARRYSWRGGQTSSRRRSRCSGLAAAAMMIASAPAFGGRIAAISASCVARQLSLLRIFPCASINSIVGVPAGLPLPAATVRLRNSTLAGSPLTMEPLTLTLTPVWKVPCGSSTSPIFNPTDHPGVTCSRRCVLTGDLPVGTSEEPG